MTTTAPDQCSVLGAKCPGVAESFAFCRGITKREAKNFYYGLRLLPEPKRSAMYALYAYMRLVDDIADDGSGAERVPALKEWEELTHRAFGVGRDVASVTGYPCAGGQSAFGVQALLWPAFSQVVQAYRIPRRIFEEMIAGQRQDLAPVAIQTFEDLHAYCYRVASVVGLASLYIFGFEAKDAERVMELGVDRGIAFQLTNILRDLREDAGRGRCYIPRDELGRFAVTEKQIAEGESSAGFLELMRFQIERAESYYQKSAALEGLIAEDARATLWAMTEIYHGLLGKIAGDPGRVLRGRVRLSAFNKLAIGWRAMRAKK